jgi:hypothetical protein
MEKFKIIQGFIEKQMNTIRRFSNELDTLDLEKYENQYVFALRAQQLYTAIEDIFIRIAKTFENTIEDLQKFHTELLKRMSIEINGHRPAVIGDDTFIYLNKLRAFRHFIRHAYDYELDKDELILLQKKIKENSVALFNDIEQFENFLNDLIANN